MAARGHGIGGSLVSNVGKDAFTRPLHVGCPEAVIGVTSHKQSTEALPSTTGQSPDPKHVHVDVVAYDVTGCTSAWTWRRKSIDIASRAAMQAASLRP